MIALILALATATWDLTILLLPFGPSNPDRSTLLLASPHSHPIPSRPLPFGCPAPAGGHGPTPPDKNHSLGGIVNHPV
jgi:hypothetical protein